MRPRSVFLAALLLALAPPLAAKAVDFQVTIFGDGPDHDLGDGGCDADPIAPNIVDAGSPGGFIGQCTLRAAIMQANFTPGADRVLLRNGLHVLSLQGPGEDAAATGDLDITSDITVEGDDYTVSLIDARKLKDRVFDVRPGGVLTLLQASLLNGKTPKSDFDPGAPGEVSGGCLRSAGTVTLDDVFMFRCKSVMHGGCLSVLTGSATVSDSIFSACNAKLEGGAMRAAAGTTASFSRVTAGACRAALGGSVASRGTLTLLNTTLTLGKAKTGGGGAALLGAASATVRSSTFAFNGKTNVWVDPGAAVAIASSIVSDAKTDCVGLLTSNGGNLESGISCGFTDATDQQNEDPLLEALAFNGAMPTHLIPMDSPAVDNGLDGGATCETNDAQNLPRVDIPAQGAAVCDAGAQEFRPPPP